jgi:YD repeat-containing protein
VTVYTYDDRGRLQILSRGSGASDLSERIETTYDPLTGKKNHESRQRLFEGEWTEQWSQSFVYDTRARLESVVHADGTAVHYSYDAEDRIATVRDENHTTPNTTYAYDPAGRVSRVTQTLATQPGGIITTHYTYHLDGSLASVTDPNGNVTIYVYDDFGNLVTQTSPVTGETAYDYDKAGNLIYTLDANGMLTLRQYDALNRVISAVFEGAGLSETVTWSYDDPATGRFGIGRLTSSTDPSGDVSYSYERRGLLRQETRHVSAVAQTHTISYAYDADGNRNGITYPSGRHIEYGFDYAGRPTNATGAVVDASYLPFGPMASLVFPNGTTQYLSYDARYRMTDNALMTSAPPPAKPLVLAGYTYDHDNAGNITSIADHQATYSRSFQYDDLNRLTVANTGSSLWQTGSYSWDAMGNLKNAEPRHRRRPLVHVCV